MNPLLDRKLFPISLGEHTASEDRPPSDQDPVLLTAFGGAVSAASREAEIAIQKHGHLRHKPETRKAAILGEEFGEACQAVLKLTVDDVHPAHLPQLREDLKEELAQVAAVALLWLQGMILDERRLKL